MLHFTRIRIRNIFLLLAAGLFITLFPAGQIYAEKPYKTCSPKEVHPIWWKARVNYDVKAKVLKAGKNHPKAGKKITLQKGKTVLLISYNKKGKKKIMLKDGTRCSVPRSAVTAYEDACTKGDYSKKTKIAFVNSRTLRSKTKYLIWVSTDMQSLTLFQGSNRHWKYVKSYKCSTGMAGYETPIGRTMVYYKTRVQHSDLWGSDLLYFLSFGGSGIHRWPGGGWGKDLGKRPRSHACVRLARNPALWMYKHIPVKTRIYIY